MNPSSVWQKLDHKTLSWNDLAPSGDGLPGQVEIWLQPNARWGETVPLSHYLHKATLPWSALKRSPESVLQSDPNQDSPLEDAFCTLNEHGNRQTWSGWRERSLSVGDVLRFFVAGKRVTVRVEDCGWATLEKKGQDLPGKSKERQMQFRAELDDTPFEEFLDD